MPRAAHPAAMKDALIAAVIAKLPSPGAPFPAAEREAWFVMMRHATDVAYGPVEQRVVSIPTVFTNPIVSQEVFVAQATKPLLGRFYVDHDGFAMCNGSPTDPQDIPPGSILWDERDGPDHGDADAIMWKTGGSNKQRMPAGVQLRPAQARAMNGEVTS